jgi:hypothetical protein
MIRDFAFDASSRSSKQHEGRNRSKEEPLMSRSRKNCVLSILAALVLAIPLAAHASPSKTSKSTARASLALAQDASVGGKQVKAGIYEVKASESTLTLTQNGKVVAEAPIEWKDEQSKPPYSSIVVDGGSVKAVHFIGKNRFAQVAEGSMSNAGQE